ncbi:MAG: hypothetical protein BKP49_09370 [Treponema sp. CETP13]|nr:MAG: hypothetical protein BKP49_09370 [Treponema sp. CETP13]
MRNKPMVLKIKNDKKFSCFLILGLLFVTFFVFPQKVTSQEIENSEPEKKTEEKSENEKRIETIEYGLDTEVATLITTLIKEENNDLTDSLIDLFKITKNQDVREGIIKYCTHFKIDALEDYAISLLEDPYDEKNDTVSLVCEYVKTMDIKQAALPLQALLETENEEYYDMAISALGVVGGEEQAVFLTTMFDEEDLSITRKQALVKALGNLQVLETWDKLKSLAEDEDENLYVRMYAAEAIGEMKKNESVDVLINLYTSSEPSIREYALRGLSYYDSKKVQNVIVSAIKDDYWKVRKKAIEIATEQKITDAAPYLRYRAQHDSETVVLYAAMEGIAALNDKKGVEYLEEIVADQKKNDTIRSKCASYLLKYKITSSYDTVIDAANKTFEKDSYKTLRYAFGKLFTKYPSKKWEKTCKLFLENDDVATRGTGLDIYRENKYSSLTSIVKTISEEDSSSAIKQKAKHILETK